MGGLAIPFGERLSQLAAAAPDVPCISLGDRTLTRAEFDKRTNRIAKALVAKGLRVGDLLTIALPNCIAFMEIAAGCWKAGVTPQPVSNRLPEVELDAIAQLAETPFIVGEAGLESRYPIVSPDDLIEQDGDSQHATSLLSSQRLIAPAWKAPTSGGSTGRPKLIVSGHPSVFTPEFGAVWRLEAEDIAIMPGPLSHNGPFQTSTYCLLRGGHLVLMGRFDAEAVLAEVERRHATWLYLVPTMMSRIHRLPEAARVSRNMSSLRSVWHLASPCPKWLKLAWIEWLGADVIWEIYGATEAHAATTISGSEYLSKPGSVGRVFMGEMKVLDETGRELPPSEEGEIFMRRKPGEVAPYHYRGAESKTLADGWESVGDVGVIDADGYVFLSDRRSDVIITGGSNVYPAEVESALEEHGAVLSCAVIGLPNADLGESIHAILQLCDTVTADELRAHVAKRLVGYKVPKSFEFVDHQLRDEAGKVRRSQLRAQRQTPPDGENKETLHVAY